MNKHEFLNYISPTISDDYATNLAHIRNQKEELSDIQFLFLMATSSLPKEEKSKCYQLRKQITKGKSLL